jgi:S-methylmethionine transporter
MVFSPNGFKAVFTTMLTVNFAFSGTELIGVTAGETKDPEKNIPKAIHTTLLRLVIFFIGSITVMAALIPYKQAGVSQSPFVLVFNQIGLPFAGDLMNFVVLTAILSAANSGLYASTRMLWSLAHEKMISPRFAHTTSRGGPDARTMREHDWRDSCAGIQCGRRFNGVSCFSFYFRSRRCDRLDGDCPLRN